MRESTAMEESRALSCEHGGAFFAAIGESFEHLENRQDVINADVLDAWFPPAPGVLAALRQDLDWLVRTSPPMNCEGLVRVLADVRGVAASRVLPGAGSSDLIYRAFGHWLDPDSRVLLLDPTYPEYAHVCTKVIGCTVERVPIRREDIYCLDLELLHSRLQFGNFDVAVIVNPNNPTGQYAPANELMAVLREMPPTTLAWIDEAYLDYVDGGESLEAFATAGPNVVVCKSLSKVYALSGMRAAYLVGSEEIVEPLRSLTPPWVIGLPAQLAAVRALGDPEYYRGRHEETARLRRRFADRLRQVKDWRIIESTANFVLCELPAAGLTAGELAARCQAGNVFIRDVANMGTSAGHHTLRIAVKDVETQERILAALASAEA